MTPPRTAAGDRTVLVVDDDELVARALRRLLERAGYRVTIAGDGNAAAEKIKHEPFDVILSDIQMPGMTGVPTVETAAEAVSLGALQYLSKPMSNSVLLSAVERASCLHRIATMKREALQLGATGATACP